MLRTLRHVFSLALRPTLDALWYGRHLPWTLRWRLLVFQPFHVLANLSITIPYLFRRPFTVDYIPIAPDRELRVLVFKPPPQENQPDSQHDHQQPTSSPGPHPPLHIDCHSGGFIGGYPESSAPFCAHVARSTGAVVVSLSYRLAPVHPFPAAIDDVDAAVAWLRKNAAARYGADPSLATTVSGFSAGGNLMLSASAAGPVFRAYVGFYPAVDMRPTPWEKPVPENAPKWDPLRFMMVLYESYGGPWKAQAQARADAATTTPLSDARLSPATADISVLPRKMFFVIPKMDILCKELLEFVERVNRDAEARGGDETVKAEALWVEDGFHGYLEVPNAVVSEAKKMEAFNKGVELIKEAHAERGWHYKA